MTWFRETFQPLLDSGQNPTEPISDHNMGQIQWWFENYKNNISNKDFLWFIDRICGALTPLRNRMIDTLKQQNSHVGMNRSTSRTFRTKINLAQEQAAELLSLIRFTYNLRLLISRHSHTASYPNGKDPHDKCADYYDIEAIRIGVEQWVINTPEELNAAYEMGTRSTTTLLRRL